MANTFVIDKEKFWLYGAVLALGQYVYVLYQMDCQIPLAFVWGCGGAGSKKSKFDVYGSWVVPWARRHGVRTWMNNEILKRYDCITTASGSKDGGLEFLKASGYRYAADADAWLLCRKPARKRTAPSKVKRPKRNKSTQRKRYFASPIY